MVGGASSSDNKVVATLRADGSVHPASGTSLDHLVNLIHYKIRTEVDVNNKATNNATNAAVTIVDLGKQLLQYARDGDLKGVKNALSRGAPFTSDWLGMSALHFAAMNNQYEICDVLLKGGINKDSRTKVDRTPLHMACYYGNESIAELLIDKQCLINPRDMLRMTPLHWAVEKGHKSVVRLLLRHNADVTITSKFGKTAIALAVQTEQADLLEELELARQTQMNSKYNEENEKETSDAVNSIMDFSTEEAAKVIIEPDIDDDMTNNSDYAEASISDLANIKETGLLDKSTINMLKDHGISMMPEDDNSKELLNTALQNGRQLVLSEGGKLLLNETKKLHNNNNNISKISSSAVGELVNANTTDNNQKNFSVVSMRGAQGNKARSTNTITKAKDNVNMYKNVRIISLNDFKKFYGNTNTIKGVQKIPTSIASSERLVRAKQSGTEEQRVLNSSMRKVNTNQQRQLTQRQAQPSQIHTRAEQSTPILAEDEDIDSIIQLLPNDSDAEMSDAEQTQNQQLHTQQQHQQQQQQQQQQHQQPKPQPQNQTQVQKQQQPPQLHRPTTTSNSMQGPKQILNITAPPLMRPLSATNVIRKGSSTTTTSTSINVQRASTSGGSDANNAAARQQHPSSSHVISLLSVPEICRQLYELRRQNDELRRKFDTAQREKEEMRQRLDRLEELLLVERTNDDYMVGT